MSTALSFLQALSVLVMTLKQAYRWLGALVVVQLLLTPFASDGLSEFISCAVPLTILCILAIVAYNLVRRDALTLLTPMPILLGWSALVFGIGPLFQWLAPPNADRLDSQIFSLDPTDYPKVALLVSVGLFITILCSLLVLSGFQRRLARELQSLKPSNDSNQSLYPFLPVFINPSKALRIGYGLLLLSVLYRASDFFLDSPLAAFGLFSIASKVGLAGVFVLAFSASSKSRIHLAVVLLLVFFESFIGLSVGMRAEALLPFVSMIAGYYIGSKSLKVLVVGIVGLAISLIFITPIVYQFRQLTWSGDYSASPLSAISQAASFANEASNTDDTLMSVWRRLDYSPWQEAMMHQYNNGNPGSTYRYIAWNFVPRILFPDKPRLVIGTDIGYRIQGVEQSSSFSGTVYGEMYWNGGWLSVIVSSAVYGSLLGCISVITLWLFSQNTWPALLIGLYGIIYGFTADTHFSVNAIGQAVIFFSLAFLYRYLAPSLGFGLIRYSRNF